MEKLSGGRVSLSFCRCKNFLSSIESGDPFSVELQPYSLLNFRSISSTGSKQLLESFSNSENVKCWKPANVWMEEALADCILYALAIYLTVLLANAFSSNQSSWFDTPPNSVFYVVFPIRHTISPLPRLSVLQRVQACPHGIQLCTKRFKHSLCILFRVVDWLLNRFWSRVDSGFKITYHRFHLQHGNSYTCCPSGAWARSLR